MFALVTAATALPEARVWSGVVAHAYPGTQGAPRQEDCYEFKANHGYLIVPHLKKKMKTHKLRK